MKRSGESERGSALNRRFGFSRIPTLVALLVGLIGALAPRHTTHAATVSISGLHVVGNRIENGSGQPLRLLGANRSSTEYACIGGWGFAHGPLDAASVQAMASWHINAVRVPLNEDCWLGINGSPAGYSGANYQQTIINYVNLLNQNGIAAIVELHWNAPGGSQSTGQQPMPDQDHAPAFWSSVATTFKGNSSVLFDLYNEPYPDNNQDTTAAWTCWKNGGTCSGVGFQVAGMQELVTTVRNTGATNIIMLGGVGYSGILSQWLTYKPTDPLNNLAASWHSYNFAWCNTASCWSSSVTPVSQQVPLIVGEIGENDCAHGYIDPLMNYLDGLGQSYLAWSWTTADCSSFPALITDYNGTPTAFGQGFRDHLATVAAAPAATTGSGSADYLLKTADAGVSGAPSQEFYDPGCNCWTSFHNALGGATLQSPTIAQYGSQFQVVVLGTDHQIYQKFHEPSCNCWHGWSQLSPPTPSNSGFTSAPAIAIYNNQFHVFVRGTDHHIGHAWYDPASGWHGWEDVSHAPSASAPSATAYTGNGDRNELHVVYLSDDSSRNLMHLIFNQQGGSANTWSTPRVERPGPWASAPAVAQYTTQLQVLLVGSDTRLDQLFYDPAGGWHGPRILGPDTVGSAPAVAQYGNQFQVFYVLGTPAGGQTNRQYFYLPGSGWIGPWTWGTTSSAPAVSAFYAQFQVWWRET